MGDAGSPKTISGDRLISVDIDEKSLGASNAEAEHEREVAIYDLLDANSFAVAGRDSGPYRLELSLTQNRLVFAVKDEQRQEVVTHLLALGPFRQTVSDYLAICERHYAAIRTASPSQIEAIDMGRRGMHNDAALMLVERLAGKISLDHNTARRLFTLLVALQWEA